MRLLALLFALYFTVLGCLPCADVEPCAGVTHAAVIRVAHQDCGTSQSGQDWCTPLCQCHCCAGFSLPTAPAAVVLAVQPATPYPALCFAVQAVPAVASRAPAAPWQPPQQA